MLAKAGSTVWAKERRACSAGTESELAAEALPTLQSYSLFFPVSFIKLADSLEYPY